MLLCRPLRYTIAELSDYDQAQSDFTLAQTSSGKAAGTAAQSNDTLTILLTVDNPYQTAKARRQSCELLGSRVNESWRVCLQAGKGEAIDALH